MMAGKRQVPEIGHVGVPSRPIICPQLGVGGLMPTQKTQRRFGENGAERPRLETMIGASALGRIWPRRCAACAPTEHEASTKPFAQGEKLPARQAADFDPGGERGASNTFQ